MRRAICLALLLLAPALPAAAQSLLPAEVLSQITVAPVAAPNPVRGADGRIHLAYELMLTNPGRQFVTLDKVEAVDEAGAVLETLEGDRLVPVLRLYAGENRRIAPGGTALIFMDVRLPPEAPLPRTVKARISATRQGVGADGKPGPLPEGAPFPPRYSFTGGAADVGPPAVVIAPPLRGRNWLAANGCCREVTSHRGAVMAVNGTLRVPERFAIDWVKLDAGDRLFTGEIDQLGSYAYYGTPVHAVAAGVVVNLYDDTVEQVPGTDAKGITPENIGGNMVVVDIGGGAYAFYAHLQKGSLKVKLGDTVKTGDVLALLGNTGNSSAPHLHFHMMDGPSPLNANSLPYVFTRFTGVGVMAADSDPFDASVPAKIDRTALAGPQVNTLPLDNQVVDFD